MPIIQDAISSLMGGDTSDDWQSKLQPSVSGVSRLPLLLRKAVTDAGRQYMSTPIVTLPG